MTDLVNRQRAFYRSGTTRSYHFRQEAMGKLRQALEEQERALCAGLETDLHKSSCESYLCEIGTVLDELRFHQRHLRRWMRTRRVPSAVGQLPGRCFQSPEPYGVVLILVPWNYPVYLSLMPLIGALSAGNTAIVKVSADAPATGKALAELIATAFPPEHVAVVEGGREMEQALLRAKVDYLFFTGSVAAGKAVMTAAAQQLIPVTLELGGKSPVIVDQTANLKLAAKRVAFGKTLNAGQTCVAPDYLLIHESVKEPFLTCYQAALAGFFPAGDTSQMVTIINQRHYERLRGLMTQGRIRMGGQWDDARRWIAPTVIDELSLDAPIMQEEIFGPILPVFSYRSLEECVAYLNGQDRPLALYLFSQDKGRIRTVLDHCSFGGGCVNDTILHLANPRLPFGGVGSSGMGSYHGKASFDTFTHQRSILRQSGKLDVPVRYLPYTGRKERFLRRILR